MIGDRRFWEKVERGAGCWLWNAKLDRDGYGRFRCGDKKVGAHRYSWEMHFGPIPAGLCVCHKCDTPACVRPDHLFVGSVVENNADRDAKGRAASGDRSGMRVHPERCRRGINHYRAKLNEDQVRAIRADARKTRDIGRDYGITSRMVSLIRRRLSWRHVQDH